MHDSDEDENDLVARVASVLGKVLPLGIATFVMVTAASTILAWASLLGQVLFRISAKDSLISFFQTRRPSSHCHNNPRPIPQSKPVPDQSRSP